MFKNTDFDEFTIVLDYKNRENEREFLKELLNRYDKDTLVGVQAFVNNYMYKPECYINLHFFSKCNVSSDFREWMKKRFPNKKIIDTYLNHFFLKTSERRFNIASINDGFMVETFFDGNSNTLFLFPSDRIISKVWSGSMTDIDEDKIKIFFSYSHADKQCANGLKDFLNQKGISLWFDDNELMCGDSIIDKIEEGMNNNDKAIILMSKSYFKESSFSKREYLALSSLLNDPNRKIYPINIDLELEEIPSLLKNTYFINIDDEEKLKIFAEQILSSK